MNSRRPNLMLVVAVCLIALLSVLAVLQYRWLGQISSSERERLAAGAKRSASQLEQDFNREISHAYLSFQIPPSSNEAIEDVLAFRFDAWLSATTHAELIQTVYLIERDDNGTDIVREFDRSGRRLIPAGAATDIIKVVKPAAIGPPGSAERLLDDLSFGPIDPDMPAIVVPVVLDGFVVADKPLSVPVIRRRLVLRLNREFLQNELLPAFVRLHFPEDGDYRVTVVDSRDPSRVIFPADSPARHAGSDLAASAAASGQLLVLRFPEIETMMTAGLHVPPPKGGSAKFQIRVLHRDAVIERSTTVSPPAASVFFANRDRGFWQVLVHHRQGSLDVAVESLRRRNLAISFSILGVLALGMLMIVTAARRSERLASQQIEFVSSVSHELRTPLSVICSAGENLADGVVSGNEQVRRYGEVVRTEGRRLGEMVEQILEFAGIQSKGRRLKFETTTAEAIINHAAAAVAAHASGGGFAIERRIAENLPGIVVDFPALSQALQNLLVNAMKYSGTSRWIGVSARLENDKLGIAVEDRGIGIPQSEMPRLFEPFFRGRQAVDEQIHGSGLGLSLVQKIIAAHGGEVSVESQPGRGTTFTILLPLQPRPA